MLTERTIRDAKPRASTFTIWDSQVRGLGVRVTPAGSKAYVVDYRVAGRRRRSTLARCSELALRDARTRAGRELVAIRSGESDPLERRRDAREALTVADALRRYFDEHAPARIQIGRLKASSVGEYRKHARRYVEPKLGRRKLADVKRRDIERLVDPLTRTQRNRVLAFVSHLFNLCERWEWRGQRTNPARGIERSPETARDRVLDSGELAALSAALDGLAERYPAPVAAIRVAALTGLRISEVCSIRWEDIDFESGRVTLADTKTGRRVHHVPYAALDVLRGILRINEEWAFSTGRSHVTYRHVRTVFAEAARAAGLVGVRLHDLRRTVMTNAAAAGVGVHVLRDLLGHRTTAMADRYVRSVGSPVADAREAIGAAMAAAMRGDGGRV
ncbi:MAG: tyrosine-type recombinase/integrase [Acidobacteria bacterium]|nr:tyrosine-type recombinase/integrase [Acidobacteriota bacterium]